MPQRRANPRDLSGTTLLVARPAGFGAGLLRAARARGARAIAIPTASLRPAADPVAARAGLRALGTASAVIFTSGAAVRHAWALLPQLRLPRGRPVLGVGPATVRALGRHGVVAQAPAGRYDSEGLLAHPALRVARGAAVAIVTAPGGRGLLQSTLRRRGARVHEIFTYRRVLPRISERHRLALREASASTVLVVSSAEAVGALATLFDPGDVARLARAHAVAASWRVAQALRDAGFRRVAVARSALAADLLDAIPQRQRRARALRPGETSGLD